MDLNKYMNLTETQRIEAVFKNANEILSKISSSDFSGEWLNDVKQDAINGVEWVGLLKGFFRGLIAVGLISLAELDGLAGMR